MSDTSSGGGCFGVGSVIAAVIGGDEGDELRLHPMTALGAAELVARVESASLES